MCENHTEVFGMCVLWKNKNSDCKSELAKVTVTFLNGNKQPEKGNPRIL